MILEKNKVFSLHTQATSYLFRVTETGHLEHLYYGRRIDSERPLEALFKKSTLPLERSIAYNEEHLNFSLDNLCLEYSSFGKGDNRQSALLLNIPERGIVGDFIYREHRIINGKPRSFSKLPESYGDNLECTTLIVVLYDKSTPIRLELTYTTFEKSNVIARRATLTNEGVEGVEIDRIASLQLDLPRGNYNLVTFDGAWGRERNRHSAPLRSGIHLSSSTSGVGSLHHNPALFLTEEGCTEFSGECYGCNLVYSGDHAQVVELAARGSVRLLSGLNPATFKWRLHSGEKFTAPEALLTFSHEGLNGASSNFHHFINHHIVRGTWQNRERPVLFNTWQATYFDFNDTTLLKLARSAADLGIELFVLDDGWFGTRDDETTSLGDWSANTKKLPEGLAIFSQRIHSMGLLFGLYCEGEMISRKSHLFKEYPDWIVALPDIKPSVGRHQYILDLTKGEVRDYLFDTLSTLWKVAKVDYVKWGMSRTFSDLHSLNAAFAQSEFSYRYMMGLYTLLQRFVDTFPEILFEATGRFDLGILCYMGQALASENCDPFDRLSIQEGSSYSYPPSIMANRVGESPNHLNLRKSSLESRFNVAAFGVLGYEIDLLNLSKKEREIIEKQVAYYKLHRKLFQYGEFFRIEPTGKNQTVWALATPERDEMLVLLFQEHAMVSPAEDILRVPFADPKQLYNVTVRLEFIDIRTFGTLLNKFSPIKLRNDGALQKMVSEKMALPNEVEFYAVGGDVLAYHGIRLNQKFAGEGFDEETRVMGDFSCRIYHIKGQK
jgi:alpha-galactosidase